MIYHTINQSQAYTLVTEYTQSTHDVISLLDVIDTGPSLDGQ